MEELPGLRVPPPRPSTGEVLRTTGIMVSMVALDRRYDMQSIGAGKAIRRTQSKGRRPGSTLTTREGSSEWPASRALWGGGGGLKPVPSGRSTDARTLLVTTRLLTGTPPKVPGTLETTQTGLRARNTTGATQRECKCSCGPKK